MNNILVITGARGIGDLIYQLPLLRSLYLTYKTKLTLISNKVNKAKDVYKHEDFYGEIIEFDHTRYSAIKTIGKIKYFLNLINKYNSDLTILTSNTTRLMLPVYFSNSKNIIIFGTKKLFIFKDKTNNYLTNSEKIILYTKNLNLKLIDSSFFLNSQKIKIIKTHDDNQKKIFINVDSHHDQNNWGVDNFINIIEQLLTYKIKIFVNFSPSKSHIFKNIFSKFSNNDEVSYTHKKDISELIEIINYCDVIVGNESGPVCLGASLKKEVHSIYTPVHTRPESQVISKNINYYNTNLMTQKVIINKILNSIISR